MKLVTLHEQRHWLCSHHLYNHGEFLPCEERARKPVFLGLTSRGGRVLALLTVSTIPTAAKTVQWSLVLSWRQSVIFEFHNNVQTFLFPLGLLISSPPSLPSLAPLLETGSHYVVALAVLEIATQTRLALKSQRSTCLCLPRARIKGLHHHGLSSVPSIHTAQPTPSATSVSVDSTHSFGL